MSWLPPLAGSSDNRALCRRLNGGNCANSLTAGTPVETGKGQKPIEDIQIGDKVLVEDPETGEQGYFEVVVLTNHPTARLYQIHLT